MRFFLLILFLTLMTFGDAMLQISQSNAVIKQHYYKDKQSDIEFIKGGWIGGFLYIYQVALGDFDTSKFGEIAVPYVWLFFLLCTLVNLVIMMNLLIAIISDSFSRINSCSL